MFASRLGEFAALVTAVCWTVTALSFEAAGKKVGSLAVNLLRLCIAFVFLSVFCFVSRGLPLPLDASPRTWLWLSLSGLVGFFLGDLCLFRAFVVIGARTSSLIMSLVPPITALIGWALMGETLSLSNTVGMILVVGGIALVVLERNPGNRQIRLSRPISGILLGLGGVVGQAVGLVFSKHGMGSYHPFAATQIRVIAGIVGFSSLFFLIRAWPRVGAAIRNRRAMFPISLGAFFGPFLGVSFSLLAVQHALVGVASTIMAIVPVLIILPAIFLFKEKITFWEVIGAAIAVSGVALLFL